MSGRFYIYGYYHPITNAPLYIGKGSGKRAGAHLYPSKLRSSSSYFTNTINKIIKTTNLKPIVRILYDNIDEDVALLYEQELIKKYGRKLYDKNGILTNMSTGGESGRTGTRHSVESRLKMSKSRTGKSHTLEHSNNISKALIGQSHTKERKRKISESLTGRKLSEKHKEKLKYGNHSNPTTTWKILDPEGNMYETSNLVEFCKVHGLSYTAIYKNRDKPIVRGKAKGWQTLEKYYSK